MTQAAGNTQNEGQLIEQAKLAILRQIPRSVGSSASVLNLATAYTVLASGKLPGLAPSNG